MLRILFILFIGLALHETTSYAAIQCKRTDTSECGIDALYASKVYRESMKAALGEAYNPEENPKKVRIHDGGWASYKLGKGETEFAARNKLPDSYFKKTQWIMVEVKEGELLKSFQVDLDFQAYSENSSASDYKTAVVENARIAELPGYKVEEQKQRALALALPQNGFTCENESLGLIFRAGPMQESNSFGEIMDSSLSKPREGKLEVALGSYRITLSNFGNKKPPQLPPTVEQLEVNMTFDFNYEKGNPDKYELAFAANSPAFSFWRAFSGYSNTGKICNASGTKLDAGARKEICETEPNEAIKIQVAGKTWDKADCHFYEKSAFSR